MAAARWKRFAFFEKKSISLNADVLDDLGVTKEEKNLHKYSLSACEAALPLKLPALPGKDEEETSQAKLWASLTACSPQVDNTTIALPHKAPEKVTYKEGLPLVWMSSRNSYYVHCFSTEWCGYFNPLEEEVSHLDTSYNAGTLVVACTVSNRVAHWTNPHLHLSLRRPMAADVPKHGGKSLTLNETITCVTVQGSWMVVGTATRVHVLQATTTQLVAVLEIPTPARHVALYLEKDMYITVGHDHLTCYQVALKSPPVVSARYDLDARPVECMHATGPKWLLTVAHSDGLYHYSTTERTGVTPIEGPFQLLTQLPTVHESHYTVLTSPQGSRIAVDIYDVTNQLVAHHVLLSPGQTALAVAAQQNQAYVWTSGGSLILLSEKSTQEKIDLLVQKHLYPAAIVVAFGSLGADAVIGLYRQYAEHLYAKGDFAAAMEQYILTIGSLESSHVIYRYLDAPKIPHLVQYLQELRSRNLATATHKDLLRTCYLKLNDTEKAEELVVTTKSKSLDKNSQDFIFSKIYTNPKEALANVCSLEARQAAEFLTIHGSTLARSLPRETAGVVLSLCLGTYSPSSLAQAALIDGQDLKELSIQKQSSNPYPISLFAPAFLEHPKLLRLLLAHCNRQKCALTPSLRRTLLELTLSDWNTAKRLGDTEVAKLRHKEAIAALTDSHSSEIGDYDALVLVQAAGFEDGELLLYERLQMTPMLLERYAKDGSEKSRRQMLAMSKTDPEVLAEVLWHMVRIAANAEEDEQEEVLEDIQEALALAKRQGVLPAVRVTRILAGESSGQFTTASNEEAISLSSSIPLSVALDYVGTILEESRQEIDRLDEEIDEYTGLCDSMEKEIDELNEAVMPRNSEEKKEMDIDYTYQELRASESMGNTIPNRPTEAFWRELNQSDDKFGTVAKYFAKGVIP